MTTFKIATILTIFFRGDFHPHGLIVSPDDTAKGG